MFEAANDPITAETPVLNNPLGSSASSEEPDSPLIRFSKYEWGEDLILFLSEKAADGAHSESSYTYQENVGSFSKELVFSEEYAGHLFRCYYDFDQDNRLVSVMLFLNQQLSPLDTVSLQLDLNNEFISLFGPLDTSFGLFDPENGESLSDYADVIKAGRKESKAIWYGSAGTQLVSTCRLNPATGQIELTLIFSSGGSAS